MLTYLLLLAQTSLMQLIAGHSGSSVMLTYNNIKLHKKNYSVQLQVFSSMQNMLLLHC